MESIGRGTYLLTYETMKSIPTLLNFKNNNVYDGSSDSNIFIMNENSFGVKVISAATAGCCSWFLIYPMVNNTSVIYKVYINIYNLFICK